MKKTLSALLLVLLFLSMAVTTVEIASASETAVVSVAPVETRVYKGTTFSVNLTIADVSNASLLTGIFCYELFLYYNAAVVNCTGVELPADHFLKPVNPDNFFVLSIDCNNTYNATHGCAWVAISLLTDAEDPKSGSGVLATATFKALAVGSTGLNLSGILLVNIGWDEIPYTQVDGSVRVFPEPMCALKTKADGCFYVPNATIMAVNSLKVELLFDNANLTGDQSGGDSPCAVIGVYPNGTVDTGDLDFINGKFGRREGNSGWDYMADVVPDRVIDMKDVSAASRNIGKNGTYITDMSGVTILFNTGENVSLDAYGFANIPQAASSFNVTRNGTPIGAMIIFCKA